LTLFKMNSKKIILLVFFMINVHLFAEELNRKHKPILAMGLSALLPGAGQFYQGNWQRGLVYLGIELLAFERKKYYEDKSDDYIREYKEYANKHWTLEKWISDYYLFNNPNNKYYYAFIKSSDGIESYKNPWDDSHGPKYYYDGQYYNTSEENGVFETLYINYLNGTIGCEEVMVTGGSCALSPGISEGFGWEVDLEGNIIFGDDEGLLKDHHLYEGISKYNVYFAGWDDTDEEGGDLITKNGNLVAMTPHKKYYQSLRNKSNDEHDKSENFLTLIFINHAASMFDALFTSVLSIKGIKSGLDFNSDSNYKINRMNISFTW